MLQTYLEELNKMQAESKTPLIREPRTTESLGFRVCERWGFNHADSMSKAGEMMVIALDQFFSKKGG